MNEPRLPTLADVGKQILVGVKYLDENERVVSQTQHLGTITKVGEGFIDISWGVGGESSLPPQVTDAAPGVYRLRSTGEEVVDPDLLATWAFRNVPPPSGAPNGVTP